MIGVLAKNDNLNPSANLAAGDTTVGSRPVWDVRICSSFTGSQTISFHRLSPANLRDYDSNASSLWIIGDALAGDDCRLELFLADQALAE
jgi:hypothetical protein